MQNHLLSKHLFVVLAGLLCLAASPAGAAETDHSAFIMGPIASGPEATQQCLKCHSEQAHDFMKTNHWLWSVEQEVDGKAVARGKKNVINNFCTSINANYPRCTSCHAGYGWDSAQFDFSDDTRVDCLVCHDTTGTYIKASTQAGHPAKSVDLLSVAQSVGTPERVNCGACHFFGGGGDAVKHGDLDSSMEFPEQTVDVHMDIDGLNFSCQECHTTEDHNIAGHSMGVTPGAIEHFGCETCHDAEPHAESRLNAHADTVACQTCHIPVFAKENPTKLSWDWSTAGQEGHHDSVDENGKHTYLKAKGSFVWGKNVVPTYEWFNGKAEAYTVGQKIDPKKVTRLASPLGNIKDENAKIYPFKVHKGNQIYDAKQNILITAKLFGEGGYWSDFDWDKAAKIGMEANGLKYSGKYGFAPTEMYWRLNHMVSPKEDALKCLDCHGDNSRMPWENLGYKGDPMNNPSWARTK